MIVRLLVTSNKFENSAYITAVMELASAASKCTSSRKEPVLGIEICDEDELRSGVRSTATKA